MKKTLTMASWLGFLLLAAQAPAWAVTPGNQCPGDCSPCLGPTDPFCTGGGSSGGSGGTSTSCYKCGGTYKPTLGGGMTYIATCDPVTNGDGATECSVSLLFSTCSLSGRTCSVIVVNP